MARLLPLLPPTVLRNPLPVFNSLHPITLSLEQVVTALPADLLKHQNQSTLDIEAPEFDQLPKLFDDADLARLAPSEKSTSAPGPSEPVPAALTQASEKPPAPPPAPTPIVTPSLPPLSRPADPLPSAGSPAPRPAADNQVLVTLRSLIAVMPDHVFACPRTELWRRVNLDSRVPLPRDAVLSQLQTARIRIPLAVAVEAMPTSILASPLPPIGDETIPLALQEVVSQLPPQLFASVATQSEEETLDFSESEIPMPFQEKLFAASEQEVKLPDSTDINVPEPSRLSPVGTADQSDIGPKVFEITADELADEEASIFAEKTAAPEPVVARPGTVVPPMAEVEQPIAETKPVEPIAEIVPPAPSVPEAPATVETPSSVEQHTAPVEHAIETPAAPSPIAEVPAAPEVVHELEAPEEAAVAPSATSPVTSPRGGPRESQFLVNLNKCTAEDLAKIEGIGPVLAQRIIEFRNARGGFKSLRELHYVPGITRKTLREFAAPTPRSLNRLLGVEHNEELTLQEIVRLTSQMKGVSGCILAMSDGVLLTGQLPPHLDQETISVFAPQLFKKVARYTKELCVGQVTRLSVFTDQQPLSIFHAGDIFLVVVHDPRHFSKALLRRCERISQEIARLCRQRAVV
ncbi:MAG TPA: helix-hairpin-helix domain-containing protein [Verrucomicrobiae bacterium]|nr:helix-hairpin-helix domain-containing protein [Verrucomicrobiae bacterium]